MSSNNKDPYNHPTTLDQEGCAKAPGRPASMHLAPYTWAIDWMEPHHSAERDVFGETACYRQEIRMDPGTTPQKQANTLIHEFLHAAIWQAGLRPRLAEDDLEEELVLALSTQLQNFITANPEVVNWIRYSTTHGRNT